MTRGWPDMDGVYTQNNEMLSPYSSPRQLATRLHIVNGLSGYNKKPLIGQCRVIVFVKEYVIFLTSTRSVL